MHVKSKCILIPLCSIMNDCEEIFTNLDHNDVVRS